MRKQLGVAFVLSFAAVLTVAGNRPASAQGSQPVPTGGGWMTPVTKTEGTGITATETKLSWSWGRIDVGTFLPLARTTIWSSRDRITAPQRNQGWVAKVVR